MAKHKRFQKRQLLAGSEREENRLATTGTCFPNPLSGISLTEFLPDQRCQASAVFPTILNDRARNESIYKGILR
jgi:hypothetical protein